MRHPRDQWTDPALLGRYRQLDPLATDSQYRASLGRAYRQERAVNALEGAAPTTTVRNALSYIIAAHGDMSIPVRLEGTTPAGAAFRAIVFVTVNANETMTDLWQQAAQLAVESEAMYGVSVTDMFIHQGIQRI